MADLYTDENVPYGLVIRLRKLGHDVLTAFEAGNANQGVSDRNVLAFASENSRITCTNNRRDFISLHKSGAKHGGVIVFTDDRDWDALAQRIDEALLSIDAWEQTIVRILRPD